jgi:hypothetical protein
MTMKLCANHQCSSYGHIVYTTATRCLFCRWDLKPTWTRSEVVAAQKTQPEFRSEFRREFRTKMS